MRTALIGVIGHIDHGKTTLVKALTGIDTDRLKEEKERGISIALGFARLGLPEGEIGFVDMPGHERFVRTMVSGATGIEAVLLVVAANEGIKPQTVEHLQIAALIGVRRGVIAVTKCDLVPPGAAEAVATRAQDLARMAGLAEAEAVPVSALSGEGMEPLRARLASLLCEPGERPDHGFFYLPVDRVFTVAGFGTVATGTLRRGRLAAGDEVELIPHGRRARVRSLEIHGRTVEETGPGRRTAVNLRGVERDALARGDALATPGLLVPSDRLDVLLTLAPGAERPIDDGLAVRLHIGTTEAGARLRLLDRQRLEPGDEAIAQLRCETTLAVPAHEPFILRLPSPLRTIGGGRILDPAPPRRRRRDPDAIARLQAFQSKPPAEAAALCLRLAGPRGCELGALARQIGYAPGWLRARLDEVGGVLLANGTVLHGATLAGLEERVLALVTDHHHRHPTAPGLPKERLREALSGPDAPPVPTLEAILGRLGERGLIVQDGGLLRRRDADPARFLSEADHRMLQSVAEIFRSGGLMPPDESAVLAEDPSRRQALRYLVRHGVLLRAPDRVQRRDILFHRDAVARAQRIMAVHFAGRAAGFPVSEAGRLLGISRKYSIPLLEHLDATGFTRRIGDRRILVGGIPPLEARATAPRCATPEA